MQYQARCKTYAHKVVQFIEGVKQAYDTLHEQLSAKRHWHQNAAEEWAWVWFAHGYKGSHFAKFRRIGQAWCRDDTPVQLHPQQGSTAHSVAATHVSQWSTLTAKAHLEAVWISEFSKHVLQRQCRILTCPTSEQSTSINVHETFDNFNAIHTLEQALLSSWQSGISPGHTLEVLKYILGQVKSIYSSRWVIVSKVRYCVLVGSSLLTFDLSKLLPKVPNNENDAVGLLVEMMCSAHREGALKAKNRRGILHQHETALDALAKLFQECCDKWHWERDLTQHLAVLLIAIQHVMSA